MTKGAMVAGMMIVTTICMTEYEKNRKTMQSGRSAFGKASQTMSMHTDTYINLCRLIALLS